MKAGGDAVIIRDRYQQMVKYPVGNRSRAIVNTAETNNQPGAEVILNISDSVRIISDRNSPSAHASSPWIAAAAIQGLLRV
ncbi:hypothetical protein M5W98_17465 [Paenibacillus apiarius]|nr:hypothetical protein [Paenibacillus apiarius]